MNPRASVLALFPAPEQMTDSDVELLAAVVEAVTAGHLLERNGTLIANPRTYEQLDKRTTTTRAKAVAETVGRPRPTKFADVLADVVTFAAVVTT